MSTDHTPADLAGTRPGATRTTTPSSVTHPEDLILPDGPIPGETTELLQEFIHPHQRERTLVDSELDEFGPGSHRGKGNGADPRPWYKRPSPWWLLFAVPVSTAVSSSTLAPRIEVYTMLACSVHKPDIFKLNYPGHDVGSPIVPPRLPHDMPYFPTIPEPSSLADPILHPSDSFLYRGTEFWLAKSVSETGNQPEATNDRRNLCAKDPVVQAAVAKLTAVYATILGVLSCVTTGWWGAYSDRHGRTVVMALSIVGLLVNDAVFVIVALYTGYMPGGYWFLVLGAVAEGFFGGIATGVAAIHAYMADTSDEGNRSRILSLSLGLVFTGVAFGPTLGSVVIRLTGTPLSVFYIATGAHLFYCLLAWLVVPESLDPLQRARSRAKYANELVVAAEERERNPAIGILVRVKALFSFLSPLTVFAPVAVRSGNPLKRPRKDWSLAFLAVGYGLTISLMGSYSYKFQYAAATFGWTAEIIGYWLSLVGAARAVFLTIILPITLKLLKPKPVIIELPAPRSASDTPSSSNPGLTATSNARGQPEGEERRDTITKEVHSPLFDLNLARTSIIVESLVYLGMALAPSALAFTVFGMMGAFGTAFSPAVQSVSLSLYARRGGTETGRLFGGLSVIQALGGSIIGPSVYGFVYVRTVSTAPRMIFYVSVASLLISCCILAFVKIPPEQHNAPELGGTPVPGSDEEEVVPPVVDGGDDDTLNQWGRDETLVDVDAAGGTLRGRHLNKSKKTSTSNLSTSSTTYGTI